MLDKALIGNDTVSHIFKFNPMSASWAYNNNIISVDTLGGRVVQLLSVNVDSLTLECVAGSRSELQRASKEIKNVMDYQIRTLKPVRFKVPSRRWDMNVYISAMPQIGWEVASTTYPFSLTLEIEEDLNKIQTAELYTGELERLSAGIGYSPVLHGGDPAAFQKIVDSLNLNQIGTTVFGGDTLGGALPPVLGSGQVIQGEGVQVKPGTLGQFVNAVLSGIGAPINQNTQTAMAAWIISESGTGTPKCRNNPMNSTLESAGASDCNSVHVKHYTSLDSGIKNTITTVTNKSYGYPAIVNAFKQNAPARSIGMAINMSGWVTGSTSTRKRGGYAITTQANVSSVGALTSFLANRTA